MTDKEIIIDGVDVSGCEFYFEDNGIIAPDGTPERTDICASPERECSDNCYCNKQCYYKQLKRLEFENKLLKADYEASEQENARLKEEIGQMEYQKMLLEVGSLNLQGTIAELRTTLQEIKKIAEHEINELTDSAINGGRYLEILQKISECIGVE